MFIKMFYEFWPNLDCINWREVSKMIKKKALVFTKTNEDWTYAWKLFLNCTEYCRIWIRGMLLIQGYCHKVTLLFFHSPNTLETF